MNVNFRDAPPTILHVDEQVIRAGKGISDLFPSPSVTIQARYAVPRSHGNGDVSMTDGQGEGSSSSANWIVGQGLDAAQSELSFEEKWEVRWPFRSSKRAEDWVGREYILQHVFTLLDIKVSANPSPLMLIPPSDLSLDASALYTQLAFEELNVPGLTILSLPLASLYALGALSGIIIHIGAEQSNVSIVTESIVRDECTTRIPIGLTHCLAHLERLLLIDFALDKELRMARGSGDSEPWSAGEKERLVKEVITVLWMENASEIEAPTSTGEVMHKVREEAETDDTFDVAKKLVGDAAPAPQPKKKAPAPTAGATDTISISIPSFAEKTITIGPIRHKLCEPLLRGINGQESLWEAVGRAVESPGLIPAERMAIWDGIGVVGEMAKIKSFAPAFVTYLSPLLLSSAEIPSDVQPAKARLLSIPDYFANFKGNSTDMAPFLGGSMVAKYAFSDYAGKHCITKVDYNAKGPAAIYTAGIGEER
ncbi:RNA polymerase II transcription factor [Kockovaella imperatae]|uniref:RNA polymerase II transcription factor n=1 Tax=Kockovaella imperatae TaxID=4999 RepID=A0A1Y1UEY9_9TREE|nr:RNA polymerase II transcription factor [Kockovaella imperatae]ORX35635.1 RNA polymerase II transcription factor [Kockovaella imperatae]